jgi:hypothetical protein
MTYQYTAYEVVVGENKEMVGIYNRYIDARREANLWRVIGYVVEIRSAIVTAAVA